MEQPRTEIFSLRLSKEKTPWAILLIILALYLSLRIVSWANTSLLESRDSMSMIRDAKVFLSFNLSRVIDLPPDTTPLYPFFAAMFSLFGWSVENGARMCSLVFSAATFLSMAMIGRRMTSFLGVVLALLLLSLNPVMISLAKSVLTEPIYIGVVHLGWWLFYLQHENLTWKTGLLLGGVFASAFLARTEGLIYLAAIPALQFGLAIFFQKPKCNLRTLLSWTLAFVVGFGALSVPQIWRVSHKMGMLAINGRQVWEVILNNPDGKSYDQKIYGLDYSPQQINLEYIQSHPEAVESMTSSFSVRELLRKAMKNVKIFFLGKLIVLIGPLGMVFAALGLFSLWRDRRHHEILLIAGFFGASLLGPFLHDVDIRHIAIVTPFLALLQGIGIARLCARVAEASALRRYARFIMQGMPYLLFAVVLLGFVRPLRAALQPPRLNKEYALDDFTAPLHLVQRAQQETPLAPLKIAARTGYFAYVANAESAFVPYTDYAGVVSYFRFQNVDFFFLEYDELIGFPFLKNFEDGNTPDFKLLYEGNSKTHGVLRLYRFAALPVGIESVSNSGEAIK